MCMSIQTAVDVCILPILHVELCFHVHGVPCRHLRNLRELSQQDSSQLSQQGLHMARVDIFMMLIVRDHSVFFEDSRAHMHVHACR